MIIFDHNFQFGLLLPQHLTPGEYEESVSVQQFGDDNPAVQQADVGR